MRALNALLAASPQSPLLRRKVCRRERRLSFQRA